MWTTASTRSECWIFSGQSYTIGRFIFPPPYCGGAMPKASGNPAPKPQVNPVPARQKPYAQRLAAKARGTATPKKAQGSRRTAAPKIDPEISGLAGRRTPTGQLAAGPDDPKYTEITPIVVSAFIGALAQSGMPT